jgi:hypothetical protein
MPPEMRGSTRLWASHHPAQRCTMPVPGPCIYGTRDRKAGERRTHVLIRDGCPSEDDDVVSTAVPTAPTGSASCPVPCDVGPLLPCDRVFRRCKDPALASCRGTSVPDQDVSASLRITCIPAIVMLTAFCASCRFQPEWKGDQPRNGSRDTGVVVGKRYLLPLLALLAASVSWLIALPLRLEAARSAKTPVSERNKRSSSSPTDLFGSCAPRM